MPSTSSSMENSIANLHFESMIGSRERASRLTIATTTWYMPPPMTATGSVNDRLESSGISSTNEHPADFRGHSLRQDIIVLKQSRRLDPAITRQLWLCRAAAFLEPGRTT